MKVDRPALDPKRVENAKRRALRNLEIAEYHEAKTAANLAAARQLATTWGFDLASLQNAGR